MIILDTNVVSEPMKPRADNRVVAWLDRQSIDTLYLTATSLAELLVGVEILPTGKRKAGLGLALAELISTLFGPRVLAFDQLAATRYAALVNRTKEHGLAMSQADAQIAAVAATHGFAVATRDTQPFLATGIAVINPWQDGL